MTIDYAKEIARRIHPHIDHPGRVAALVEEYGGSEKAICLAWLHDIMEENPEGFCTLTGVENISMKSKWYLEVKKLKDWSNFAFDLARLSEHWDSVQQDIKTRGRRCYLTSFLLDANLDVLLVKLSDILASVEENSDFILEKIYFNAVRNLIRSWRLDLTEGHRKLAERIRSTIKGKKNDK